MSRVTAEQSRTRPMEMVHASNANTATAKLMMAVFCVKRSCTGPALHAVRKTASTTKVDRIMAIMVNAMAACIALLKQVLLSYSPVVQLSPSLLHAAPPFHQHTRAHFVLEPAHIRAIRSTHNQHRPADQQQYARSYNQSFACHLYRRVCCCFVFVLCFCVLFFFFCLCKCVVFVLCHVQYMQSSSLVFGMLWPGVLQAVY